MVLLKVLVIVPLMTALVPGRVGIAWAGDPQMDARVLVRDALVMVGKPVRLEARLISQGMIGDSGLGGEQLEFHVAGAKAGAGLTGGDGVARLEYRTRLAGNHPVTVRLIPSKRVTGAHEGTAVLSVWEKRRPILLVELASLMEPEGKPASRLPMPLPVGSLSERKAVPDAADELKRLARFYFNVLYISTRESGDPWDRSGDPRDWLKAHQFPSGHWIGVREGREGLRQAIEELKADGWDNLRTGIGRTKEFAEVLVGHRIGAVIVPEPQRGELPRKAKTAKEWKEIRKNF